VGQAGSNLGIHAHAPEVCCLTAELSTDIAKNDNVGSIRTGGAGSSLTAQTAELSDSARREAEESELMQPRMPQQQVAGDVTCAKLYQACTCSAQ
jgi:hypothetical protein